jgi:hypothetical protein
VVNYFVSEVLWFDDREVPLKIFSRQCRYRMVHLFLLQTHVALMLQNEAKKKPLRRAAHTESENQRDNYSTTTVSSLTTVFAGL